MGSEQYYKRIITRSAFYFAFSPPLSLFFFFFFSWQPHNENGERRYCQAATSITFLPFTVALGEVLEVQLSAPRGPVWDHEDTKERRRKGGGRKEEGGASFFFFFEKRLPRRFHRRHPPPSVGSGPGRLPLAAPAGTEDDPELPRWR